MNTASQIDSNQPTLPLMSRGAKLGRAIDEWKRFVKTQKLGVISLSIILVFIALAVLAPVIAPYDPVAQDRTAFMLPPSQDHIMGTDDLGRDIFSRIIFGSRVSLLVGIATVVISMVLGTVLGVISGFFGKIVDMAIQRVMDAIMAIPPLILALFIAALLGPAIENVIIALTIVNIPHFARITRGEMLRIKELNYVEASRASGAGSMRIIFKHGIPNMMAPIIVIASLTFGQSIIAEASLSFLGIGTPPPEPSWGLMLSGASSYMENAPWMVIFPGLILSIAVLAFNLLGDSLRDFLDPKLNK